MTAGFLTDAEHVIPIIRIKSHMKAGRADGKNQRIVSTQPSHQVNSSEFLNL